MFIMIFSARALVKTQKFCAQLRYFSDALTPKKGLVLGAYEGCSPDELVLTQNALCYDQKVCGKLSQLLKGSGLKRGKALVFGNLGEGFEEVAVAGLGAEDATGAANAREALDVQRENVRAAAGAAARALQERGMGLIEVEDFGDAEAAAEGSHLAVWQPQVLKKGVDEEKIPKVCLKLHNDDRPDQNKNWMVGKNKAECQNIARRLEDTPANLMTPSLFAQSTLETLCPASIQVDVKGRDWLEAQRMTAFLSVARSSCHPPLFVETTISGAGSDVKPIVIIGKGVTFDAGGLNVKSCHEMIKPDMAGAAVVVALMRAAATMCLPINIIGLLPVCENALGGVGSRPGDVVLGMNGKTIRIENTDNEGRVVLADTLAYAEKHKPCLVVTVADLTTGLEEALGEFCSGVFSTSDEVWDEVKRAGASSGDRFWRFPLWRFFSDKVTDYPGVDVNNVGKGRGGEPCLGAAFLQEFAPCVDFVHVDISGSGGASSGRASPYLRRGLASGRPVRGLAQFLYQVACPSRPATRLPPPDTETLPHPAQ